MGIIQDAIIEIAFLLKKAALNYNTAHIYIKKILASLHWR